MKISSLKSFQTVRYKQWLIKASSYNDNICVVLLNVENASTVTNFFTNEDDARTFVEYWIAKHER